MRRTRRVLRSIILISFLLITFFSYLVLEPTDHTSSSIDQRLDHLSESVRQLNQLIREQDERTLSQSNISVDHRRCTWQKSSTKIEVDISFDRLYDTLPFDNPQNQIWAQGFDIHYNLSQWTSSNKLKVFVMPHSHCDPGWLNTFDQYFHLITKRILDTVITMLNTNEKYKFVWAEISYLDRWWNQATELQRQLFKQLVRNGQLEIVTGGWVMNDEASTHYFAMLDQLIEGHQFLARYFGNLTVRTSWANDPFGYSPTMAYLLKASGIDHLAIQRVHYHVKKALAKEKQLEFNWQQTWDRSSSTEIFTHILPFFSYDIPRSCGPDPAICCQFDFLRGPGSDKSCPWGPNPTAINEENVQEKAQLLLDQYRKKAQLFRTNVLLVPLGDDFRYGTMHEARLQFHNYDQLFFYLNQRIDWHVEIQYGTLSDYFQALFKAKAREQFPSYMGDFFTYADRADDYWSGYYTTRAFFKRLDRIVQSYLRSGEILFATTSIHLGVDKQRFYDDFSLLIRARQHLGLFQHHDGITGTAREHVVADYGEKLLQAIRSCQYVLERSISRLLFQSNSTLFTLNEAFHSYNSLLERKLLSFENRSRHILYVYNPTDRARREIISFLLDVSHVSIISQKQSIRACQIDPQWSKEHSNTINNQRFKLSIQIDVRPYSIKEYTIDRRDSNRRHCPLSTIEYMGKDRSFFTDTQLRPFRTRIHPNRTMEINNRYLTLVFTETGAIRSLRHRQSDVNIFFSPTIVRYGTSSRSDHHSGAYLFIPNGQAKTLPISSDRFLRLQRGPLVSRIDVIDQLYTMQYRLTNSFVPSGQEDQILSLAIKTHLIMRENIEFALRLSTGIDNGVDFYTDLNGFQMIRRRNYEKLPLQGNVYPMANMAYIEDDSLRLTILTGQPSGIACLKSGQLDIFLDRRLTRDDGRGLGEGVTDNRPIKSLFRILLEDQPSTDRSVTGYPTLLAHHLSMELLYPLHLFQSLTDQQSISEFHLFSPSLDLPADYHLVNLRTLNINELALIFRRLAYDCRNDDNDRYRFQSIRFEDLFPCEKLSTIAQTSLSLQNHRQLLDCQWNISIENGQMMTFRIFLSE